MTKGGGTWLAKNSVFDRRFNDRMLSLTGSMERFDRTSGIIVAQRVTTTIDLEAKGSQSSDKTMAERTHFQKSILGQTQALCMASRCLTSFMMSQFRLR